MTGRVYVSSANKGTRSTRTKTLRVAGVKARDEEKNSERERERERERVSE